MSMRQFTLAGACMVALMACGGESESDAADSATAAIADAEQAAAGAALAEVPAAPGMSAEQQAAADAALADSQAFLDENRQRAGVTVTDSGVQVETLQPGEGQVPTPEDYITLHYVGKHADGTVFDSSRGDDGEGQPVQEALDRLMPGLKAGILEMQEGETAAIVIPPAMAFGPRGTPDGTIGPNEALIFEVELVDVTTIEELQGQFEELAAENRQKADIFLAENAGKETVQVTETGLQYEVLEKGEGGVSPEATDTVEVHYEGTLLDGTVFDSSYDRGEPISFALNQVIPGWTEGVQLMETGDTFRFFIPPEMAYGERGNRGIGPNELLVFKVELIDVEEMAGGGEATE